MTVKLDVYDLEALLTHLEREYLPHEIRVIYNRLWDAVIAAREELHDHFGVD